MSGTGAPNVTVDSVAGQRVAIVAAQWHDEVMAGLLAGAERACEQAQARVSVLRVPGSFELPVACQRLAHTHIVVVALGVVIRGGTPHFDYVCQGVTMGLTRVALETETPIGFGVLTCDTEEQALARAGLPGSMEDKGFEAAAAAINTWHALQNFDN